MIMMLQTTSVTMMVPQRSEAQFSCDANKKGNHHDVSDCAGTMQLQQVEAGHPHRHPHVASVTQRMQTQSDSMRPNEEVLRNDPLTLHEARRHLRATESQDSAVRASTIASNAMDSLHSSPPAAAAAAAAAVPATEAARVLAGQVTTPAAQQRVTTPATTPPPAGTARAPIAAVVVVAHHADDNDEQTMMVVFTTATGKCYHNESCFYSPVRYMSEADAQRSGKRACRRCGGMPFRRPLLQQ